jgi:UDP-2,3-diacylglucosamine pyrophosphatase LpxH
MYDAIIISDIHLGSQNCQAKALRRLLRDLAKGKLRTSKLILNGDVVDSIDFRRLSKAHWKVLSLLRKLSRRLEIIWISGNHDGSAHIISQLLGVKFKDEHILEHNDERILVLHGHQFDNFLDAHPVLTWVGDQIYLLLQKIDRTHYVAKLAKSSSKTFLRCARRIEDMSVEHARRRKCTIVCCGHTHHGLSREEQPIRYYNSGCWTELPCSYLTVADGVVRLEYYGQEVVETVVETGIGPVAEHTVENEELCTA